MEEHRAIQPSYMTVGEIAGKMGVTVRTLQYYDREGILSPSSESEGGRRLYTHKDIVRLHQIQSMKYLGFSLADIKTRLPSLNTPGEVSAALAQQAQDFREKIKSMQDALESIEKLGAEVAHMETVDWAKYADIVVALRAKNDLYWILKHFGDNLFSHIRSRFDRKKGEQMQDRIKRLMREAAALQESGHSPESEQAQALAKDFWGYLMDFSGGDVGIIMEVAKLHDDFSDSEWKDRFAFDKEFMGKTLSIYCASMGANPFEEDDK